MKKDPETFVGHILESIEYIESYTKAMSFDDFEGSVQLQDAVIRRLEVIGEAVKNIPEDYRERLGTASWKQMAGMRDVLIHEYFGVDLELIWKVVQRDLPQLKQLLERG